MGVERGEGAQAVVVGVVEEQVAAKSDEGEEPEQAPADGSGGRFGQKFGERGCATFAPVVEEIDEGDDEGGFELEAEEGVGPAAVMLEGGDGAADGAEVVEVRSLGGEGHGEGGVGGPAVEAGTGEDGAGHEVGKGIHGVQDTVSQRDAAIVLRV